METHPGAWCSRDNVRFSMVREDEEYFAHEDEVFESWILSIQEAIASSDIENVYIDATHLNDKSRNKVLNRLNLKDVNLCAVNFMVPLEECFRRNEMREGRAKVPRGVIRRMFYSFVPADAKDTRFTEIINISE